MFIASNDSATIHVYLTRVPESAVNCPQQPPHWLGANDRKRYVRMRSVRRRQQFLAGRALFERALREYSGGSGGLYLHAPEGEAPRVVHDGGTQGPAVGLAHSHDLVVCALAQLPRLGVDVESLSSERPRRWLAARNAIHPQEMHELDSFDDDRQWPLLLRHWVLKEAYVKALGVGLAMPFRMLRFVGRRLVSSPRHPMADGLFWRHLVLRPESDALVGLAWSTGTVRLPVRIVLRRVEIGPWIAAG